MKARGQGRSGLWASLAPVSLVAGREIAQRARSRSFAIATGLLLLASIGGVLLAAYLPDAAAQSVDVAVVAVPEELDRPDASGAERLRAALAATDDTFGLDATVVELADEAEATAALRDGRVDVIVDRSALRWHEEVDTAVDAWLRSAMQQVAVAGRAEALRLTPDALAALQAPVALGAVVLDPVDDDEGVRIATATVGVVLLFLAVQLHGNAVLMGVVEEKSTRVVEVLLTHVRPRELLAGKVIGIGLVGLAQVAVVALGALATLLVVRDVDVPNVPASAIGWFVVWFVVGFALYATMFATAGSLVSRQEDAQAAAAPTIAPLVVSYIMSIALVADPDSTFARVLALVPLSAPMAMPVRLAVGDPAAWEVVAAMALCLVTLGALVVLGGRIYSANLLRTGSRVPWRRALGRAPRDVTN
jgi:ABC-2 type transport system permease protein